MLNYELHDSLIEKILYSPDQKKVEIFVELCNWKQKDYKESEPEMLNMCILFEGVESFQLSNPDYKFDGNEILDVSETEDSTTKFSFLTEDDVETILIIAQKIECVIMNN